MKRLNSHKYNVLLVKDDVGRPKPTTRRLPDTQFIFGKAEIRDPENAGQGKQHLTAQTVLTKTCNVYSDLQMVVFERNSPPTSRQRLQET